MEFVTIKGEKLAKVGLGTWHMGESPRIFKQEVEAIQYGIDLGSNIIDTAEMYGEGQSEIMVGEAMTDFKREDIFLISKFYPWHAGKKDLITSFNQSLKRLKTDYLDLYLYHWPGSVPLKETITQLEEFKKEGYIKHWGISNFDVEEVKEVEGIIDVKEIFANEVMYNIASRGIEYDLLPYQQKKDILTIAYSPLAQGDTLGENLTGNSLLKELSKKYEASIYQVMLAFVLQKDKLITIPQSSDKKHIQLNLESVDLPLTLEDMAQIDGVFTPPKRKMPLAML